MTKNSRIKKRNMYVSPPVMVDQIDGRQELRLRKVGLRKEEDCSTYDDDVVVAEAEGDLEAALELGGDGGIQL
jgi:hypothetical protein